MEQRGVADGVELPGEGEAAIADRLVETFDGVQATLGEWFVDKCPKKAPRRRAKSSLAPGGHLRQLIIPLILRHLGVRAMRRS